MQIEKKLLLMNLPICRISRTGRRRHLKDKIKVSEVLKLESIQGIQARKHIAPLQRKLKYRTIPPKQEQQCRQTVAQVISPELSPSPQKVAPRVELSQLQQSKQSVLRSRK